MAVQIRRNMKQAHYLSEDAMCRQASDSENMQVRECALRRREQ